MVTRQVALLTGVMAALVSALLSPAHAAPSQGTASEPSWLMSIQAPRGSVEVRTPLPLRRDSTIVIRLKGVQVVAAFTERPVRATALMRPEELTDRWAAWFGEDEPNAVLTYARTAGSASAGTIIVTLAQPRWDEGTRTLTFRAHPTLALVGEQDGKGLPRLLVKPSLVIDSLTSSLGDLPVYEGVGPYNYRQFRPSYPVTVP